MIKYIFQSLNTYVYLVGIGRVSGEQKKNKIFLQLR